MKTHTRQELKRSIEQAKIGCCFQAKELLLLFSLLPKQEYDEGERIMITCALPKLLLILLRNLVESGKIESVSFLLRLGLLIYNKTQWVPPLPKLPVATRSQKVDYSFRVEKDILKVWQKIKVNKVKVCESWAWFLGMKQVDKLT